MFRKQVEDFCWGLVSHYVLDGGKLVVAHAGLKEQLQGRSSARVRDFGLYGESTGETDEFGLPVCYPWASEYRGRATVLYGHTPVPQPEWVASRSWDSPHVPPGQGRKPTTRAPSGRSGHSLLRWGSHPAR